MSDSEDAVDDIVEDPPFESAQATGVDLTENVQATSAHHEVNRFPSRRIFSKHGAYPCTVCKTNPSKYKFRCCRFGYCSTECFSKHKESECSVVQHEDRPFIKRRCLNPLADLDIPEEDLIPKETLEALKSNKKITEYFADPKLRKIICKIDSAKDRALALERQMLIDPDFSTVVMSMAQAIGLDVSDSI